MDDSACNHSDTMTQNTMEKPGKATASHTSFGKFTFTLFIFTHCLKFKPKDKHKQRC